jgi:hypothetical protein
MCAIRASARRQLRIVGHDPFKAAQAREPHQYARKLDAPLAFARSQNHEAPARESEYCGARVRQAIVVHHQHKCGQL